MYLQHIESIFRVERFRNIHLIVGIEANSGWDKTDQLAKLLLAQFPSIEVLTHKKKQSTTGDVMWGVVTTETTKNEGVNLLEDSLKRGALCYEREFASANVDRFKQTVSDQLMRFHRSVKEPPDPAFGKFKVAYTGKGAHGSGQRDDVVLCIQQWLRLSNYMRSREDFIRRADQAGWHW